MIDKEQILRWALDDEEKRFRLLSQKIDEVCTLIISEKCPEIDIVLAKQSARDLCCNLFPDEISLFDMIYGARFKRLEEQFRTCLSD